VTYTATVSAVADLAGNALEAPVSWSFTTALAPDTTPPEVASALPAAGATGVPVTSAVTAVFSEPIDPASITAVTFTLSSVSGTVTYDAATRTAVLTPSAPLADFTTYTATVTTGVADLAGNPMAAVRTWTFTTVGLLGDVDGSGAIDEEDARLALQIAAGNLTPTARQSLAGDVAPLINGVPRPDGRIDVGDAVVILRKIAGLASW
jgi:hypothetical protein